MKECGLCHKTINTKKERYTHVEDWEKENMISDIWCHVICFNKSMNPKLTEIQKQAKDALEKGLALLKNLPIPQSSSQEVYDL